MAERFWEKPLEALTPDEWEALCDGCGRCCLHKLEDEDSGEVFHTQVACRMLDLESCRCQDYPNRLQCQPECLVLKREDIGQFGWLPATCAYRLRAEGKPLPPWHRLLSGDPESVHASGASVRAWAVSETQLASLDELEAFIIDLSDG